MITERPLQKRLPNMGNIPPTLKTLESNFILQGHQMLSDEVNRKVDECEEEYEYWLMDEAVKKVREEKKAQQRNVVNEWCEAYQG